MTIGRTVKLYKLPEEHVLSGFRPMLPKDVGPVHKLLSDYLKRFKLCPIMNQAEVKHWLLPRPGVIYTLVRDTQAEGSREKKVTDVCSFYRLPSTILGHEKYDLLKCAYSYWNVANSCSWVELMNEALIYAKREDFDAFNALDVMDNEKFLKDLKFGQGDGYLQYYLFNWRCNKIKAEDVGLVLL